MTSRSQIGAMITAYLAMFERYGYQVALTPSGELMRHQFLVQTSFKDMLLRCQMTLMGDAPIPADETLPYWKAETGFTFEPGVCFVGMRNVSMTLPCSRDPSIPIAAHLRFTASQYTLRPDFRAMFV